MRNKHTKKQNDAVASYFVKAVFAKYTIPTLCALIPTFIAWFLIPSHLIKTLGDFQTVEYIYIFCLNIITTIATVSIYHTIRTVANAVVKLNNGKYSVTQKMCKHKYKHKGSWYCQFADGNSYKIYGKKTLKDISEGDYVDLIVITNEYGARMWEFVLKVPKADA